MAKWIMTKRVDAPKRGGPSPKAKLAAMVHDMYGMNHMHAAATDLSHAASRLEELEGVEAAREALAALNEDRAAMGIVPACLPTAATL